MLKIKRFQGRILLSLLAIGLVPTAILLLAGTGLMRSLASTLGTAGPWGSVAESGQLLLERVNASAMADSAVLEAAQAHGRALSEGLRGSQVFALVLDRLFPRLPWIALGLALVIAGLASWAARQLSRGFSRPIADLVTWTQVIGQGESLPPPGPADARGVEEFSQLREALRRMAAELETGRREAIQAAKLRSWTDMARRVAHELKNPLTPMRIAASNVSRLENEVARESGEVLLEEIRRLDDMARTFSQFGRMPEGPPSEVDIVELLQGLVRQHQGSGAALHLAVQGEIPHLSGHYDALERSFRNLLLNALDAAGPQGRVEVEVWEQDGVVHAAVRDTGPGIPPENLDRIWEPDFTTKNRGTGLGLPMVRQTIAAHHGRVDGMNHQEGGAVFRVELPLPYKPGG